MGVVVVGPSGSGKSTLWRLLRDALLRISKVVKKYVMNPKAMPRQQLLGHIDLDTREWSDGVLTYAAREVVKEPIDIQSWIVCDGDIDPEWIESLNSVLDDNRLLTMPSGERIQFGPNVNFLFETHDLSCASPATISRMGMIFMSDENTDIKALIESWLNQKEEKQKMILSGWIEDYFYQALDEAMKHMHEMVVETTIVGLVLNGLSHLYNVTNKAQFTVSLVKGLGGNLPDTIKQKFSETIYSITGESPPDPRRILDTFYDQDLGKLNTYSHEGTDDLTVDKFEGDEPPIIKTSDVQRGLDYFSPLLSNDNKQPFILVGPEGCGKGQLLRYCFDKLRSVQVNVLYCSAQTGPEHVLQKLNQSCMTVNTNNGRVYRPKDCERLIFYLKDINLPKPDKWGTSQLVAFLQQVLTYQGFYDSNLEFVGLEGVQIVCSMNAGTSMGRHKLSTRFTSIVRICTVGYPSTEQLQTIYSSFMKPVLEKQFKRHPIWSNASKVRSLSNCMIKLYEEVKGTFTVDDYSHYLFTPRDLTAWINALLRYDLTAGAEDRPDYVLKIWIYEAQRLFRDKLATEEHRAKFDGILNNVLRSDWSIHFMDEMNDLYFRAESGSAGSPLPVHGRLLSQMNADDLTVIIEKALVQFSRDHRDLDLVLFKEVLCQIVRVERVLTAPGGSLLLAGRSGVGRRTAVTLASHMHQMSFICPKMSRSYGSKQFKTDLKTAMQQAGVDDQQVVLMLEDHNFVESSFLELINSVLAAGEVPGLYTPEELEPLVTSLRDEASEAGFRGTMAQYFAARVRRNMHIVLIMDCNNVNFAAQCESNPSLYKKCSILWLDSWSRESMVQLPHLILTKEAKVEGAALSNEKPKKRKLSGGQELLKGFLHIHESCIQFGEATPRRYMAFVNTYKQVYSDKKVKIETRTRHLQAGVTKLNEAKQLVDELKSKAADQSKILAQKQLEADDSLKEITETMQNAGDQKIEMQKLKDQVSEENVKLEKRKKEIDIELEDVMPIVEQSKRAVGSIKSESLGEIRAFRAPPDVVRDILEGVLRLMSEKDVSWNAMKKLEANS